MLDGQSLPWVDRVNHLGCILEEDNSMKMDISAKRGQFIRKINSLLQEFHFVSPPTLMSLVNSFATSFYGSSLWNLQSKECDRIYNPWNVMIRRALNIDYKTHRFLIELLSKQCHLKTSLLSRYVKFYKGLINNPKFTVRFLARICENDLRTVLGRTLQYIKNECHLGCLKLEKLSPQVVKSKMKFRAIPCNYEWACGLAIELLEIRDMQLDVNGFSETEINTLL